VWAALAGQRPTLTFATQGPADLSAQAQWQGQAWQVTMHTPAGDLSLNLHVAGAHNVKNALAAAACAIAAGAPADAVRRGLEGFRPVKGRSQIGRLRWQGQDITLVDDTYVAQRLVAVAQLQQLVREVAVQHRLVAVAARGGGVAQRLVHVGEGAVALAQRRVAAGDGVQQHAALLVQFEWREAMFEFLPMKA